MEQLNHIKPAIKPSIIGCLNCGDTEVILPMDTKLHNCYGGWTITKSGEVFFAENHNTDFEDCKTIGYIEEIAAKTPHIDWMAVLNMPLRSAVYQRHGENKWVLVGEGKGFA